jgi:hypothetical protein
MNSTRRGWALLPEAVKTFVRKRILHEAAGRDLTVKEDDTFVVSYPKSGNTWIRFLIGNIYHRSETITFSNIEEKVPDIYHHSDRSLLKLPRPRILKSHESYDARYPRVIYVVRDPRDVVVSYYHYLIKMRAIDESYPMGRFVEQFIAGEWDWCGSWRGNVESWLQGSSANDDFLLLRYEDMLSSTFEAVERIALFLGKELSEQDIQLAIDASSFDRMRSLEQEDAGEWKAIRSGRRDKPFMRSGKAEGWRSTLAPEHADRIRTEWGDLMQRLKYD